MLIPSQMDRRMAPLASLSRRVNANSQRQYHGYAGESKLIKKGEC